MLERESNWARFRRDLSENHELYLVWVLGIAVLTLRFTSPFRSELYDKWTDGVAMATLLVLNVLAWALHRDRAARSTLLHNISLLLSRSSAVRVFDSWQNPEVLEVIKSAHHSIVFVDSWFDEWSSFPPLIRYAAASNKLDVTLYQLDSSKQFGAQRLVESRGEAEVRDNHLTEFQELMTHGFAELKRSCKDIPNATVNARTYCLLPSIRLIVVDDAKFLFSWFPLGATSQNNSCVLLSVGSQYPADLSTVEHLRRQLKYISHHSAEV